MRRSSLVLGNSSRRVNTPDRSAIANPSILTIQDLGYADHQTTVVCEDATFSNSGESRILIGKWYRGILCNTDFFSFTCVFLAERMCSVHFTSPVNML